MDDHAIWIDLEFMELDTEPRLTHWEAFLLGLEQEVNQLGEQMESNAFLEWV